MGYNNIEIGKGGVEMDERFSRTEMLLGVQAMEKLRHSRIAVFGVGGVGGYVSEALARCGVGTLDLIDRDVVSVSNINRQIIALTSTVGRQKTEVAAERAKDINPDICVNIYPMFYTPETASQFDFASYDYIVDAIDDVKGKLTIIKMAKDAGVPVISSMGAGNKLITDIYKTSVCPLARVMRKELKARGIPHLTVVYSKEEPKKPLVLQKDAETGKVIPASISFVPSAVGLIIASKVVRDIALNAKNL